MNISEELLMAYADGELEAPEHAADRAAVESAMQTDASVARRVEKHRALRRQLSATFDGVLSETLPERLVGAVHSVPKSSSSAGTSSLGEAPSTAPRGATITDLNQVRAIRAKASSARGTMVGSRWTWMQRGAVAASLVIGVAIGHFALQSPQRGPIATRGGQLVAQAGLEQALSNRLAGEQVATEPVHIGLSFKAKSGSYCRTFVLHDEGSTGGVACREGNAWSVRALARTVSDTGAGGAYRPAGSEMPPTVRAAVEEQIDGEPLDAAAEAKAKQSGWN
ncbi:MAG: hypothetical protein ABI885_14945 [Gammaproteobacteria bacterium]